jgi:hypothetical protein
VKPDEPQIVTPPQEAPKKAETSHSVDEAPFDVDPEPQTVSVERTPKPEVNQVTEPGVSPKKILENAKVTPPAAGQHRETSEETPQAPPQRQQANAGRKPVDPNSTCRDTRAIEDDLPRLDDQEPIQPTRQKLFVTLHGSADYDRDRRRLRRIYGELQACPGNDVFAFYVVENGKRYLIDFPNDTTGICPELMQRLVTRVGAENLHQEDLF